ncbi:MAG TPA: carbohydrate binding domain-containing protein [Thermodesulfobacteriota bacterium]|nr:carbohydrate binding domain-containing protein [Thermodesulfobacteriota bacterium]
MKRHRLIISILLLITLTLCLLIANFVDVCPKVVWSKEKSFGEPIPSQNKFEKRYVFFRGNMNNQADVNRLVSIMKRASAVGYNGFVIGERGSWRNIEKQSRTYFRNFARIRSEASKLGVTIIPVAFDQWAPTRKDRNLAEAFPVIGTKFVVKGKFAYLEADLPVDLQNSGFEKSIGHQPTKWIVDQPGKITFIDTVVKHSGRASIKIKDPGVGDPRHGHARIRQKVSVAPFRAYELSLWIKTRNFNKPNDVKIYISGEKGDDKLYSRAHYAREHINTTQDWEKYTINFNSLSNKKITIWLGAWSKEGRGEVWFDDVTLKEVGLKKMVRRSSIPITVSSWDGKRTYDEGSDYLLDKQKLIIRPNSSIPEGQALRVTWYQLADVVYNTPEASACYEKFFDINMDIAKRLNNFLSPPGFMMNYDEWRVANWDPSCRTATGGEYMARAIRISEQRLRSINPNWDIYVWNDMFDPYHNAINNYWMVKGTVAKSWLGVSSNIIIMNWGSASAKDKVASMRFWHSRGNRQVIAGYYESVGNVRKWLDALDAVEVQGVRGVIGFMYTTWRGNYHDLEEVANLIQKRGRWGSDLAFPKNSKQ